MEYKTEDFMKILKKYNINNPCELENVLKENIPVINNIISNDISIEQNEIIYKIGSATFNPKLRILTLDNKKIRLSPKESDLFRLLCLHKNDLLTKNEALNKIFGINKGYDTNEVNSMSRSIDVYINKLRNYFKNDGNVRIDNVHGEGFCLVDELNK